MPRAPWLRALRLGLCIALAGMVLGGCGTWASRAASIPQAPAEVVSVAGRARVTLITGERVVLDELFVTPDSVRGIRVDDGRSYAAARRDIRALETREMDRASSGAWFAIAYVVGYLVSLGALVAATWE